MGPWVLIELEWRAKGKLWAKKITLKSLIVFFDIHGLMHHKLISEGHMDNKTYYLAVSKPLWERIRQKRPDLWILHNDNALFHRATAVTEFKFKKPSIDRSIYTIVFLTSNFVWHVSLPKNYNFHFDVPVLTRFKP